jgi:hypothetical protein
MRLVLAFALAAGTVAVAAPAHAEPPVAGTCLNYSTEQWVQAPFTAVPLDCLTSHTGEVLGTVTVPADIAATGYGSVAVKGWAFQACQSVAVSYAWTASKPTYPKASYVMPRSARLYVQLPGVDAWNAGERWAVCLGQSRNVKLSAPLPRTGSIRAKGLKPYVCLNPRGWGGMKCSKTDAVRLTNQVWIPGSYSAAYPGTNRMLTRTEKACQELRKKGWTLRTWYVPGKVSWDRGNRYGFCEIVK